MQVTTLVIPWLCVLAMTLVYGALVYWLLRRHLDLRLAGLAFIGTAAVIGICLGVLFLTGVESRLGVSLMGDLQAANSLGRMFTFALVYAALPEEAAKIGVVVLLLLLLPRWQKHRDDPAGLLLFAALGFALCESLLYVSGFSVMPQFKEHLIAFAITRGIFGGLVHALLGLVAGFILAWGWRSSLKWLWVFGAYVIAVLLHASFDGSLLHLVFQGLKAKSSDLVPDAGPLAAPVLASAVILLILAIIGLIGSRRLGREPAASGPPAIDGRVS